MKPLKGLVESYGGTSAQIEMKKPRRTHIRGRTATIIQKNLALKCSQNNLPITGQKGDSCQMFGVILC